MTVSMQESLKMLLCTGRLILGSVICSPSQSVLVVSWCARRRSACVPPSVIVRHKSSSHCDRGGVTQGKVVQAEHQALPCGTKCFTNVLKKETDRADQHSSGQWLLQSNSSMFRITINKDRCRVASKSPN